MLFWINFCNMAPGNTFSVFLLHPHLAGRVLYKFLVLLATPLVVFVILTLAFPLPAPKQYSLVVLDRNGEFLHAFLTDDGMWRFKTSPSEIPPRLRQILLHKEDRYFYYHPGVNPVSIARALLHNIVRGRRVSGASTITMQVARMMDPRERTYSSKCIEIFRAIQLEMRYSKEEILDMYLSMVPLGGNIEGVQSAAYLYYKTPLERLNLAQLLDLILVPNDPNGLRPDRNAEKLFRKRIHLGEQWIAKRYLSTEDSVILWQTPASVSRTPPAEFARHFALRVKEQLPHETEVVTSLDKKFQLNVEKLVGRQVRLWASHNVFNGAAIVIDNADHDVIAYVGSEGFDDSVHCGQVDAVQSLRSPGSTLKPFLYSYLIDKGTLTPKTRLLDVPYDVEGYCAENYDGTYAGWVFADDALRHSLNVPMIRLLYDVGAGTFAEYLVRNGFTSISAQKDKLGLSIILGGCGVSLEELTSAYASFPNRGIFFRTSLTKEGHPEGSRVFSEASAYIVSDILAKNEQAELHNSSSSPSPQIAFKTGTSYGRRDAWCIGYSSRYTVGVWLGNADNKGAPDLVSTQATVPLLFDIFDICPVQSSAAIMPLPPDVGMREVCSHSGKVATANCTSFTPDLYSKSQTLQLTCDIDKEYYISPNGSIHYCTSCLGRHPFRTKVYEEYPPEYLSFMEINGRSFTYVPPHNPACERVFGGKGPQITSPTNDMTYLLISDEQTIALTASSGVDVKEFHWYVDNKYIARKEKQAKIFFRLNDGRHSITCVDDKGRSSTVTIAVRHL